MGGGAQKAGSATVDRRPKTWVQKEFEHGLDRRPVWRTKKKEKVSISGKKDQGYED